MGKKHLRKNAGFTLIETIVAIVVLGIIVAPVGGALVTSRKINAYAGKVLQARLAVSSATEMMMADGVDPDKIAADHTYTTADLASCKVAVTVTPPADPADRIYEVEIVSTEIDSVNVTTRIRRKGVGGP